MNIASVSAGARAWPIDKAHIEAPVVWAAVPVRGCPVGHA